MNKNNMSVNIDGISLNEEEFMLMEAFVRGPAYPLMQKILIVAAANAMGKLENQDEPKDMYRTQGEIRALKLLRNIPGLLVAEELKSRENKKAQAAQKHPGNKPKPSPVSP